MMRLFTKKRATIFAVFLFCLLPQFAFALDESMSIDGEGLSILWGIPFAAILLSIAFVPIFAPVFWHHHFGKVIGFWAFSFIIPFILLFDFDVATVNLIHAALAEYIPFILLLLVLFTVSGGIYIESDVRGTPMVNMGMLILGAALASVMGTTGASMLMIRPILRANAHREKNAHVVIFFIFLVSNIGGSLTPLGDPPLFLGFLKGVDFFWTLQHLWPETLFLVVVLLVMFYILDHILLSKEKNIEIRQMQVEATLVPEKIDPTVVKLPKKFAVYGKINFLFLFAVVGLVLLSGMWKSPHSFDVFGTEVMLPNLVRDLGFIGITYLSLLFTSKKVRRANDFGWEPMQEVGKIFAGIFFTIIPVIAMLRAGESGNFAKIVSLVHNADGEPVPIMYFWATGLLSAFLDNAPTYLVFFNSAGGDAAILTTTLSSTLVAISAGAVFMGAMTYIGNAPNLMVKSIADNAGVKMPSFFGYMAWSFGILVPLLLIVSFIWYT